LLVSILLYLTQPLIK